MSALKSDETTETTKILIWKLKQFFFVNFDTQIKHTYLA